MIGKPGDREHPPIVGNPRPQEPFAVVQYLTGERLEFYTGSPPWPRDPNAPIFWQPSPPLPPAFHDRATFERFADSLLLRDREATVMPEKPGSDGAPDATKATPAAPRFYGIEYLAALDYGEGAGSPGEGNDMLDADGRNVWTGRRAE